MTLNSVSRLAALVMAVGVGSQSFASGLLIDIGATRSDTPPIRMAEDAVRRQSVNLDQLISQDRLRWKRLGLFKTQTSFPTLVRFSENGRILRAPDGVPGDITLRFKATGNRAFPDSYRLLLQSVYDQSKPVLDTVFGTSALGGEVVVSNYDADIADREAVSGGFYVPNNGSGVREIRFPIFTQSEAAAVNFVHCLLLAYQGDTPYGYDAFEEGLVRAATIRVARTPGALPATLDSSLIENALDSTYDVGAFYDWFNQPSLSGPTFIAPNLRDLPLPVGGSVGGPYLLRYQMAGTAWQKAVVENPGFIAEFNRRFYAEPGSASNVSRLIELAQAALDTVKGGTNSKIEGLLFSDWFARQYILGTQLTLGPKVLVQPIPFPPEIGTSDFAVFDVGVHYFETQLGGNEDLLSATAFPIFWDPDFNRVTPSAQDSTLSISGGYSSVTPNFPDFFAGAPYRLTVDIPILDRIARAHLPAGGVATATNPDGNDCYGTIVGLPSTVSARVAVSFNGVTSESPISNGAFGFVASDTSFLGSQRLKVEVIATSGGVDTVLLRRNVNKGPGSLGLDLRISGSDSYSLAGGIRKGINAISLPIEPFDGFAPSVLQTSANELLLARYNSSKAGYDYFPDIGPVMAGAGYFVRSDSSFALTVAGRANRTIRSAISTRPGWNLVGCPLTETVPANRIMIVRGTDPPKPFIDALGVEIGFDYFSFVPGSVDPVTGVPETGAFTTATAFEPGKAYFLRVLVPEGITLLFAPASDASGKNSGSRAKATGWRVKATVVGTGKADVFFGQSKTATPGFDLREDSTLPPGIGGLAAVLGSGGLYRDIRRLGNKDTFDLKLSGLRPGKLYKVSFELVRGVAPNLKLVDVQAGASKQLTLPKSYSFRPTGTSYSLKIVGGGSR